ncbi:MAG: TGS domain-containing protein [Dehalococcoidia bacterium]|jgi:ribosome-interacting GTPase 1|nr:TGS domain-containing protein [Chloroflexota bacterium]MCK4243177.1 TGS domain-containing protein [Dehalococcoidia bacterium]
MPANLPPEYFQAEKTYRQAKTPEEKVEALEAMLSAIPKHKGTDKLRALLRSKVAKFSEESQRKLATGRRVDAYYVKKEGAGQVILVGLPNAGKSQLVAAVTEASPNVADYPYSTQNPTPGMMNFENIQIQLVDIPPIIDRGARPWLPNLLRGADLLLLMVDLSQDTKIQMETMFEELEKLRIKPIGRKESTEQWVYHKKALVVGNKGDVEGSGENYRRLESQYGAEFPIVSISAKEGMGLEMLKKELYRRLEIIRVHTKAPGRKADLEKPVILKRGSTVEDFAQSIHKDFHAKLKFAQLWGSGKFDGQRVSREHILEDGDVIELRI